MTTPPLPPEGHEPLPAEFLREHGAQKGMKYRAKEFPTDTWGDWTHKLPITKGELDYWDFIAPIGTIAAATTPLPMGKCDCHAGRHDPVHQPTCSIHTIYRHILPHELAAMANAGQSMPEGLIHAEIGKPDSWRKYNGAWPFEMWTIDSYIAYAIPMRGGGKHGAPYSPEEIQQVIANKVIPAPVREGEGKQFHSVGIIPTAGEPDCARSAGQLGAEAASEPLSSPVQEEAGKGEETAADRARARALPWIKEGIAP